ncbi:undecaprenyl-phosphate glucose phosphotransferase [Piscinibacter sp. HJYY11]|uniref:undecaprenyl-phosphate glucose phosphotransferase n=1 Tax=Piscinibacter sp. HJYY11 TaxID=2801333 RepID=UPI00191FB0FC|nr:undecaprenyl-phosphate glucose phosphotransferase [Piscinibacter sp. HJYY11]MBL0730705.1 undecaprenyl-phosphate glucose phosphotransferase [Piscinibacter sp. HJYY11]
MSDLPILDSAVQRPVAGAHIGPHDATATRPERVFPVAPPSIHTFVAAVAEPLATLLTLALAAIWFDEPIDRPELILGMLVLVLTFPGVDRCKQDPFRAGINIVSHWVAVLFILMLFGYATDSFHFFSREVLLSWAIVTPAMQWLMVTTSCRWLRRLSERPEYRRRAVVVGAGENGVRVAHALTAYSGCVHELVGYFEDRADRVHDGASGRVLGRVEDVVEHVKQNDIHNVYITLPLVAQPRVRELISRLQDTTTSVHYVPDFAGVDLIQGQLQDLEGIPVVSLLESPITGTNHLVKRATDIVLSSIILVLISPVLLAVAIGVKMSSPGPIIFKQRRTGLDGKEILVFKFRSMRTQDNGPVVQQATRNDPRITPFGAFIRKTSLDELPQLFNVLLGTMSLVGPRPHAVAHNEEYRKIVQAYMLRHKVRPGITGWAQVNGFRGETDTVDKMAARVRYDLEYLRNWSLALDLKIIARTVRVLFFDRNAY